MRGFYSFRCWPVAGRKEKGKTQCNVFSQPYKSPNGNTKKEEYKMDKQIPKVLSLILTNRSDRGIKPWKPLLVHTNTMRDHSKPDCVWVVARSKTIQNPWLDTRTTQHTIKQHCYFSVSLLPFIQISCGTTRGLIVFGLSPVQKPYKTIG